MNFSLISCPSVPCYPSLHLPILSLAHLQTVETLLCARYSARSGEHDDKKDWFLCCLGLTGSQTCLDPPCLRTFTLTVTSAWKIVVLFPSAPTSASLPPPSFRPQLRGHLHGEGFLGPLTSLRPHYDTLRTTCHFLS